MAADVWANVKNRITLMTAGRYSVLTALREADGRARSHWGENVIGARELCNKVFPPLRWMIPDLFPEGVTLLASRPKVGKSWLLQQIGSAVAMGQATLMRSDNPVCGDVLYLNLEDGFRRAQRRMTKYFGASQENWPARLTIARAWRPLDQGGAQDLRDWCNQVEKPTLILIDTLKKVRAPKRNGQRDYDADYEACEPLISLAHEFPGLGIIVACHVRKMEADDVFDTVSGTLGLTGGVDAIAILQRAGHGSVTLHVQGRDMSDDVEKAVSFDRETCRWTILGEASEINRSETRKVISDILLGATELLRPKEIAEAAGIESNAVRQRLFMMVGAGEVVKEGDRYRHPDRGDLVP